MSKCNAGEKIDVEAAIEELGRSSFVEITKSDQDQGYFLSLPLAASAFGRRKFAVSPMKSAIEADLSVLYYFGAGQRTDIRHGIGPRISRMFQYIAKNISTNYVELQKHIPIMEFIAREYPPAWLLLSQLYEESGLENSMEEAIKAMRRYLESDQIDIASQKRAWGSLARLCGSSNQYLGEAHALVEKIILPGTTISEISEAANHLNSLLRPERLVLDSSERKILVRKIVDVFEKRISEHDVGATDLSRLAWLYMKLQQESKALEYVRKGLALDPQNEHCLNLVTKLDG